jgi:ABC-type multidrug transport system permease subunit
MNARIFLSQLAMSLKVYLRTPSAVFWVFAFPILMLFGFGLVFGGRGDGGVKLVWLQAGPPGTADAQFAKALQERGLVLETLNPEQAEARWKLGKLPAMLEGVGGQYHLRVNTVLVAQGMQTEAMVQQGFLIAQARAQGAPEPARIPVVMGSPGGHHGGPYAAYLLPGLLGLNLLTMGVFGAGIVDVMLREKGGYKRLATTPLPRHVYLAAQLCLRLIVIVAAAAALLLAGRLAFGVHNQGSLLALLALLMLGAACFISLGYVLGSLARNVETYNGIANFVFLPLMLLSGVYFSLDAAPQWLQQGVDLLPLAPLLRALRAVFIDGAGLASQARPLAVVAAWTVVLFTLATRRFKWV